MEEFLITDLTETKKGGRYNIYLDGEYYCTIPAIVILTSGLKVGSVWTKSKLDEVALEANIEQGFNYVTGSLLKALKTEHEVCRKLNDLDYPSIAIEKIIEKLKAYNFLNDYEYCLAYFSTYANKYGSKKLVYDLKTQKKVDEMTVFEALDKFLENESACKDEGFMDIFSKYAFKLAKKQKKNKPIQRDLIEKIKGYLFQHGFSAENIDEAIEKMLLDEESFD